MRRNKWYIVILFFIIGIVFYLLNYYTPLLHDDIAYLYKFGPKSNVRPTNIPIKNLLDVIESQYFHYIDVNGRLTSHFILQSVLLIAKSIFNILNTGVFLGIAIIIHLLTRVKNETYLNSLSYIFIFLFLWYLTPFFGQTMLWTTGAINYLWTTFLVLFFIFFFKKEQNITPQKTSCPKKIFNKQSLTLVFSGVIRIFA